MVMADPLSLREINQIESQLYSIYNKLLPLSKKSVQDGDNFSTTQARRKDQLTLPQQGKMTELVLLRIQGNQ